MRLNQRNHPRRKVLRECLANPPLFALLKNHTVTGNSGVIHDQGAGGNHESGPESPMRKREIAEPRKCRQNKEQRDGGSKRLAAPEPGSKRQSKEENEPNIE